MSGASIYRCTFNISHATFTNKYLVAVFQLITTTSIQMHKVESLVLAVQVHLAWDWRAPQWKLFLLQKSELFLWDIRLSLKNYCCCPLTVSNSNVNFMFFTWSFVNLTHWGWDKMATIFLTTFSNAFSWMKMYHFWPKLHWSLSLRVQLLISQHWFG